MFHQKKKERVPRQTESDGMQNLVSPRLIMYQYMATTHRSSPAGLTSCRTCSTTLLAGCTMLPTSSASTPSASHGAAHRPGHEQRGPCSCHGFWCRLAKTRRPHSGSDASSPSKASVRLCRCPCLPGGPGCQPLMAPPSNTWLSMNTIARGAATFTRPGGGQVNLGVCGAEEYNLFSANGYASSARCRLDK